MTIQPPACSLSTRGIARRRGPLSRADRLVGTAGWLLAISLAPGCGIGTAAIAGANGGGENAAPVGSDLQILGPAGVDQRPVASPAKISFKVTDEEGDRASVSILFATTRPSGQLSAFKKITRPPADEGLDLKSVPTNEGRLTVDWDFATDLGGESFRDGIALRLAVENGISPHDLEDVEIGNDPPQLLASVEPTAGPLGEEPSGNIDVGVRLSDAASDRVDLRVEFDVVGDEPDSGFRIARAAATPSDRPTPPLAFQDFALDPAGSDLVFRWDSAFSGVGDEVQLPGREVDVVVRFSVTERLTDEEGNNLEEIELGTVGPFRVDNNQPPLAVLGDGLFTGVKDRGTIPVPMTIIDAEDDDVDVIVQWRSEDQAFPALPSSPDELRDLLRNPSRRGERLNLQIAEESPLAVTGRIASHDGLGSDELRLPELAGSASSILGDKYGIVGRVVEILGPAGVLRGLDWDDGLLDHPVAMVGSQGGRTVFGLDQAPVGWRLREIDLETGDPVTTIALGNGSPKALRVSELRQRAYVASSTGVFGIDLSSGEQVGFAANPLGGQLRDLAILGDDQVVASGASKLVRLDLLQGLHATVLDTLDEPWGVVRDPRREGHVLLAESGANRILSVSVDSALVTPLEARVDPLDATELGSIALPTPRAIALERGGTRLLALCLNGAKPELRQLELGSPFDLDSQGAGSADPFVAVVGEGILAEIASLSVSSDGARLLTYPQTGSVHVAGGVEVRRGIVAFDPVRQAVRLEAPLGATMTGKEWRIPMPLKARGSPSGQLVEFLWDSSDVPDPDSVRIRLMPIDADVGTSVAAGSGLSYRSSFEPREPVEVVGEGPRAVVAADLDSDGDQDLVTVNGDTNNLTILFQRAPWDFSGPITTLAVGSDPRGVGVGDLDGDGDADLACTNSIDGNLSIFYQEAPESFSAPLSVAVGQLPTAVIVVDVNADGRDDLAVANTFDDTLSLLIQDSDGVLVPIPSIVAGNGPTAVDVGDLDMDGDVDFAVANQGGELTLHLQAPPLSFSTVEVALGFFPRDLSVADLDGDGDSDIVVVNSQDEIRILKQVSPGAFAVAPESLENVGGITDVVSSDLDQDGDVDLIVANAFGDRLVAYYQTSPGEFAAARLPLPTGDFPSDVIASDIDGNGTVDIVAANERSDDLSFFEQRGPGALERTVFQLADPDTVIDVAVADLDTDGDVDFITANSTRDDLTISFQTSPGVFTPAPNPLPTGRSPSSVDAADLDADGDLDVISVNASDNTLSLFFNQALGEFVSSHEPVPTAFSPRDLAAADLDEDGDVDIAVGRLNGSGLTLVAQVAPAEFEPQPELLPTGLSPSAIAAADVDGDGDRDLVTANAISNDVSVLRQTSPGTFDQLADPIGVGERPSAIAVADLDADGDLDLITANSLDNNLTTLLGDGTGSFISSLNLSAGVGPFAVVATDLDLDGDFDLTSASGSSTSVFYQVVPGKYSSSNSPLLLGGGTVVVAMAVGDLDSDGDPDLIRTLGGGDNLEFLFNGD